MSRIVKGSEVAERIKARATKNISQMKETPTLVIIQVGTKLADTSYKKSVMKNLVPLGITCVEKNLPEDITQADFVTAFKELNEDKSIHSILLLKPLPVHLDEKPVAEMINPEKDVDCMGIENTMKIYMRESGGFSPCTPDAVMEILDYLDYDLTGKLVALVGFGKVVGKPLSIMLANAKATVTICNRFTDDIPKMCRPADVLISAAGAVNLIDETAVNPNMIVIDVGINQNGAGKIVGDVDFDNVVDKVAMITPVPGGVGTVTNYMLADHVVRSCQMQSK